MNNGNRSQFFQVERGFKQGDPISSQLFILMAEVIANKIRQNANITGITVDGIRKVLGQFADDMWTVSRYNHQSYENTLRLFKEFEHFSGLLINYNKTEILRIGSLRKSDAKFVSDLPIIWSEGPVKILGIQMYSNLTETVRNNYENAIQKVEQIVNAWSQ